MSRFFFSWYGNKRLELGHVDAAVDLRKFKTIVEPFAGSAALSLEAWARGLRPRFVVNDRDPHLVAFLRRVRDGGLDALNAWARARCTPDAWKVLHAKGGEQSVEADYYRWRVRGSLGRIQLPTRWPSLAKSTRLEESERFFQSDLVGITAEDWLACANRYRDDPSALVFLDPPYFSSFNQGYFGFAKGHDDHGVSVDNTEVYIAIRDFMLSCRCAVVLITNANALLSDLYRPWVREIYPKRYAGAVKIAGAHVRKSANHLLAYKPAGAPDLSDAEVDAVLGLFPPLEESPPPAPTAEAPDDWDLSELGTPQASPEPQ